MTQPSVRLFVIFNHPERFTSTPKVTSTSIGGPKASVETNVAGPLVMLEPSRAYAKQNDGPQNFRYIHVSTDEVYGSLGPVGPFTEEAPYAPNLHSSANKAGSDLLVRVWHHPYGLPVLTSNCSNNHGPCQNAEKLDPTVAPNAPPWGRPVPVHHGRKNVHDWFHVKALLTIGGHNEIQNVEIIHSICRELERHHPKTDGTSYADQIHFVPDRPGHDRRYVIDASKASTGSSGRRVKPSKRALREQLNGTARANLIGLRLRQIPAGLD